MGYLLVKFVHVAAVVIFLGNITTGLFWKAHADRSRVPRIILHTLEGIVRSDRWFTVPGVVVIVVAGLAAAIMGQHPILRTGWIFWSIVLFTISGLVYGFRVAPLQARLVLLARSGVESGRFDWARYRSWSIQWEVWGAVALLAPAGATVLMVLKPWS